MADDSERSGAGAPTASDRSPADVVDALDRPVLLFDGVCNLCNATIRAIVRLDEEGEVLFAPLQSDVAAELLDRIGMDPGYFDSVVLVEKSRTAEGSRKSDETWEAYTKSTAILRVCRKLDGPFPLLYPLVYLPKRLRDAIYDFVAEHRYQVFGKKEACPIPSDRVRQRFVERSLA